MPNSKVSATSLTMPMTNTTPFSGRIQHLVQPQPEGGRQNQKGGGLAQEPGSLRCAQGVHTSEGVDAIKKTHKTSGFQEFIWK
jgi:hypothetical protein